MITTHQCLKQCLILGVASGMQAKRVQEDEIDLGLFTPPPKENPFAQEAEVIRDDQDEIIKANKQKLVSSTAPYCIH